MQIRTTSLLVSVFAACGAEGAEPRPQGSGLTVRGAAGVGVGSAGFSRGSDDTHTVGLAGGAALGFAGRWYEFAFETAFQPFRVDNPVARESFRVVYLLPSLRIHGQNFYFRAGLGWARYSWSGPDASVPSDGGPAISGALGYEFSKPAGAPLSIELYYRSGTPDFEIGSSLSGVQVGLSWYSRKG